MQRESLGSLLRLSFLLLVLSMGLSITGFLVTGPELTFDSRDYAQLARELFEGRGFTSKLAVPELIPEIIEKTRDDRWPTAYRPPLPVAAIAFSFYLFGVSDSSVVIWSSLFSIGSVLLLFWCFQPIFGSRTAFLAALIFCGSRCALQYGRTGLTEPSAMFFLLLALMIVIRWPSGSGSFLVGLTIGLCALSRSIALVWTAPLAIFLAWAQPTMRQRAARGGLVFAGFLLPTGLLMATTSWEGSRGAVIINLAAGVGDPWEASVAPISFLWQHLGSLPYKVFHQGVRPLIYLFQMGSIPLFSGLIPFGLLFCRDSQQRNIRNLLVSITLLTWLVLSPLVTGDAAVGPLRYFDPFVPLLLPWAVQLLDSLYERLYGFSRTVFSLLLLAYLLGNGFQAVRNPFVVRGDVSRHQWLAELVPPGDIIASTWLAGPAAAAWYANRHTVFLPLEKPHIRDYLESHDVPIRWYLTTETETAPEGFSKREQRAGIALWKQINPTSR